MAILVFNPILSVDEPWKKWAQKNVFSREGHEQKKCKRVGIKKTSFSLHLALQKYCTYRIFGWFDLETGGEKSEEGTAVWTMFVLDPAKTL